MKTGVKVLISSLVIAGVATGVWLFVRSKNNNKKKQDAIDVLEKDGTKEVPENHPEVPKLPPAQASAFPLRIGSTGDKVTQLQAKLGISPTTGYFGTVTQGLLKKNYGVGEADEDFYNGIIDGSATKTYTPTKYYTLAAYQPTVPVMDAPSSTANTIRTANIGDTLGIITRSLWDGKTGEQWVMFVDSSTSKMGYTLKSFTIIKNAFEK